ncbi:dTDP-4-dehydrorhamnose 3,5-epimerase [Sunxiuqinia sp. sy24]|uniref:dTDP-4-dehydrorhamnose 3,5-epimerase n=1 Tax=Sunxiuqinia sp. sy24 TaxID=3461495 RepID=UPI004045F623
MKITETPIDGLLVLTPRVFQDERGYFLESFNARELEDAGISRPFVQDNESKSSRGVIRGLHYQLEPYAQAKLVRVIEGAVFDVAVDLRKDSPTFGQWYGVELTGENKKQFYVPRGFAHGFSVLSETAVFAYKCDAYYHPQSERGIRYNDPELQIDWRIDEKEALISGKDQANPLFREAEYNF